MTIEADHAGDIADFEREAAAAADPGDRRAREMAQALIEAQARVADEAMAAESAAAHASGLGNSRAEVRSQVSDDPRSTINRLEHDLRDANNTIRTLERRARELRAQVDFAERLLRR